MPKILITGANGQVGWELQQCAPEGIEVVALARNELDIRDQDTIEATMDRLLPDAVINAAAYTAVDRAEQECELAFAVNATGAAQVAKAAVAHGCRMLHLSTDFVFDGETCRPYQPADPPNAIGVYGASKLEGERLVQEVTKGQALIMRTAWVYSVHGANFVKTMLRLMREREQLGVVADQVGTPTWAHGLARALWDAVKIREMRGIHHWTDAGVASWYDFAVAIQEEAVACGLLEQAIPLRPIRTEDYPIPAKRPFYSVLDKTSTWEALGYMAPSWRTSLRNMLQRLRAVSSAAKV